MKDDSVPPEVGNVVVHRQGNKWVQTERAAHEAWGRLCATSPSAAAIMHILVAHMGGRNAIVIGQKVLARLIGKTDRTVRTAIATLKEGHWIQVVKLNGPGTVCAYVVNDQVAWGEARNKMVLSSFSATVVASAEEQPKEDILPRVVLRRIPILYPGEQQLPSGPGEDPPSEPPLPGMEVDVPSIVVEEGTEGLFFNEIDETRLERFLSNPAPAEGPND